MKAAPDLASRGAAGKIDMRWTQIAGLRDLGCATLECGSPLTELPEAVAA